MIAVFYMRGGHVIEVGNVESVSMESNSQTGSYNGYSIVWKDKTLSPKLFTLSIPDIVAVVAREE